jgi:hypothetical protein
MKKRTSGDGNRVGYGNPPKENQFRKGTSGNPRGRPPKQERSLIPRQVRNDVLEFSQKPVRVRTRKGEKEMPAVEALLQVLLAKATAGHLPSIRFFFGLYEKAVLEHYETHRDGAYEQLESLERAIQLSRVPVSMSTLDHLNHMRRQTRALAVRPASGQGDRARQSDNEDGENASG